MTWIGRQLPGSARVSRAGFGVPPKRTLSLGELMDSPLPVGKFPGEKNTPVRIVENLSLYARSGQRCFGCLCTMISFNAAFCGVLM